MATEELISKVNAIVRKRAASGGGRSGGRSPSRSPRRRSRSPSKGRGRSGGRRSKSPRKSPRKGRGVSGGRRSKSPRKRSSKKKGGTRGMSSTSSRGIAGYGRSGGWKLSPNRYRKGGSFWKSHMKVAKGGRKPSSAKKRAAGTNPWIAHVKAWRKKHPGASYSEALKEASKTYRK